MNKEVEVLLKQIETNLFNKLIAENFPTLRRDIVI